MLDSNTCRYGTDIFGALDTSDSEDPDASGASFTKNALLESKSLAWNCSNVLSVDAFDITEIKPANTKIRFVFKISNKYYTLDTNGAAVLFDYDMTVDNVLKYGNYRSQLVALQNVPAFVGKKIYPVIALYADSNTEDVPAVKLALKVTTPANTLTYTPDEEISPIWELTDANDLPTIIAIEPDITCTGSGEVTIKVRLRDNLDNWTSYMELSDAVDKEAQAVQFKITYKVSAPASGDSARVNFISVSHTYGKMLVADENADLYTIVQSYEIPLQMCHVTVRHSPLIDSKIYAYVNFMHPTKHRELIRIGQANGSFQELVLGVDGVKDTNIDASSIELFAGTLSKFTPITSFSYNSETSTVALTAKKNTQLYASYDYEHDVEVWRKMTEEVTEPYNDESGDCMTRFTYSLSDQEATDKVISNVRIVIKRPTGTVKNYSIGAPPTAQIQQVVLPHIPLASSIKFTDENVSATPIDGTNVIEVIAPKNTERIMSYKWRGESVTINSIACGWSVA